jgi:serine protease
VAQNCTVMSVRVLGECRTGYASDVADAIVWAAGGEIVDVTATDTTAKIIMIAFSGYGACPGYLQSAVTQAISLGAILVAAAGNQGQDASQYFPGNCEGTIWWWQPAPDRGLWQHTAILAPL